jgi:hypothetical protein
MQRTNGYAEFRSSVVVAKRKPAEPRGSRRRRLDAADRGLEDLTLPFGRQWRCIG